MAREKPDSLETLAVNVVSQHETIKTTKTIGISVRNPVANFALHTMLAPIAAVTSVDYFSFLTRQFEAHLYPFDLLITDLADCAAENVSFDKSNHHGSHVLAFIPTHIAVIYFFRLHRANIPVCLWRDGLAPVLTCAEVLLGDYPARPESTIDQDYVNYLNYGTKNLQNLDDLPSHLRILAPRLNIDRGNHHKILAAELDQFPFEIQNSIKDLHKHFKVSSDEEVVKIAELRGIHQLQNDEDPLEKKFLEDNASSVIAKWLARKKAGMNTA